VKKDYSYREMLIFDLLSRDYLEVYHDFRYDHSSLHVTRKEQKTHGDRWTIKSLEMKIVRRATEELREHDVHCVHERKLNV
jgi:hypothetical protein